MASPRTVLHLRQLLLQDPKLAERLLLDIVRRSGEQLDSREVLRQTAERSRQTPQATGFREGQGFGPSIRQFGRGAAGAMEGVFRPSPFSEALGGSRLPIEDPRAMQSLFAEAAMGLEGGPMATARVLPFHTARVRQRAQERAIEALSETPSGHRLGPMDAARAIMPAAEIQGADRVVLQKVGDSWVARVRGPHAVYFQAKFDKTVFPTGLPSRAPAQFVRDRVAKQFPSINLFVVE